LKAGRRIAIQTPLHRCRCRDASRHGRCGVLRDARRHLLRLFLTPVFYVLLREMEKRVARGSVAGGSQSNTAAHYLVAGERHQSSAWAGASQLLALYTRLDRQRARL